MKKLLIGALLSVAAISASAQSEIFNDGDHTAYFGARISLDITAPGDVNNHDTKMKVDLLRPGAGFSFGGIYNMPIIANLYFEPGFNFYYRTTKYDKVHIDAVGNEFLNASQREFGFAVPVMVGYRFNFNPVKVSVFTGPEFSVGLSGKIHAGTKIDDFDMSGSTSLYDSFNRADVSWRFGAGVTYDHYYVGISGAIGLCNKIKKNEGENISLHSNLVSISLGYNF